ncbi:MAG: signal peptidase I [Patescibacteria group bacterium]|mgnify:FL=1
MKKALLKKLFLSGEIIFGTILVLVIVVSVFPLIPPFKNYYHSRTVLTGSMEPKIPKGSVVINQWVDQKNLKVDDVITYQHPADKKIIYVTHRVVKIDKTGLLWRLETKGDANPASDFGLVTQAGIEGKVILIIPLIGYLIEFFKTLVGFILLIVLPLLIFIVRQVKDVIKLWPKRVIPRKSRKTLAAILLVFSFLAARVSFVTYASFTSGLATITGVTLSTAASFPGDDVETPISNLFSLPPATNQNPLSIGYSASDGSGSGVDYTDLCYSYSLNPWTCGNYFNFTFPLGEGTYYFDTIAHDLAGNSEKSVNNGPVYIATRPAVIFDITPPTTNQITPANSYTGQNLLTSSWTHDSPVGDYHQVDEPGRGQVTLLGNQSDTFSGTDSISQNLYLPQNYSGTFQFSYRYVSNDTADYDQFSVGIFHQDGVQLLENILTDGNNTGTLSYDTGWKTLFHSLQNLADRLIKLVFSVSDTGDVGAGFNSYALIDDLKISTLDLRLGETTVATFDSVDTGSGIATTTPPITVNVGETKVNFSATDLAGNIESTHSSAILTLPHLVLNKIIFDQTSQQIEIYNNSDLAVNLSTWKLANDSTEIDIGSTSILPHNSLFIGFTLNTNTDTVSLKVGSSIVDATTYQGTIAPNESWVRTVNGVGPWSLLSPQITAVLTSRLSVNKIVLTVSNISPIFGNNPSDTLDYEVKYTNSAGLQGFSGRIDPQSVENFTSARDFYLGTCSSGYVCTPETGIGSTFTVDLTGNINSSPLIFTTQTFTLN